MGRLRWVAEQVGDPTRSRVQVRTRSGDDPQPVEFTRIGKQSSGRLEQRGDTVFDIPIDAPWKRAEDVEDSDLESLIANILDNEEMDGREALLTFGQLPFAQRSPNHPRPSRLQQVSEQPKIGDSRRPHQLEPLVPSLFARGDCRPRPTSGAGSGDADRIA